LPAFVADKPDPLRRGPEARPGLGDLPSPQKGGAGGPAGGPAKQANASPYAGADRPRPPLRPYTGESPAGGGSSVVRSVLGWLFAIAALAALAYLANTVFTRPDPRKTRQGGDGTTTQAPGP
jgi:hypothetical protein